MEDDLKKMEDDLKKMEDDLKKRQHQKNEKIKTTLKQNKK